MVDGLLGEMNGSRGSTDCSDEDKIQKVLRIETVYFLKAISNSSSVGSHYVSSMAPPSQVAGVVSRIDEHVVEAATHLEE